MPNRLECSKTPLPLGVVLLILAATRCSINARQGEVGVYLAPADVRDAGDASIVGNAGDAGMGDAGSADADIGDAGIGDVGDAGSGSIIVNMTIRDFKLYDANDPTTNPDFHNIESDRDIVANALGSDLKPVYQAHGYPLPTFGKVYFDQWYRDVPGTNISVVYPLTFTPTTDGQYEYDCRKSGTVDITATGTRRVFFPIDDGTPFASAFGNQGNAHNYAFTGELHAWFTYPGQGAVRVRSDDDMYVFINDALVINLGGIHGANGSELDLSGLGLTTGNEYPLDLFYAERQGKTGDILISTSLVLRAQN